MIRSKTILNVCNLFSEKVADKIMNIAAAQRLFIRADRRVPTKACKEAVRPTTQDQNGGQGEAEDQRTERRDFLLAENRKRRKENPMALDTRLLMCVVTDANSTRLHYG